MTNRFNPNPNAAPRRGSVLIFALAILAVLALLGATYVTRANLDRVSATASAQRSNLERQPEKVVARIQTLLAADLFGNKIVTDATPRSVPANDVESIASTSGNVSIWPRMFEDGEHWDFPSVDEIDFLDNGSPADPTPYTFGNVPDGDDPDSDPVRLEARLRYDAGIQRFETAAPDDAWLAATEPVKYNNAGGTEPLGSYRGLWDTWPQITNLRSAYRWTPDADRNGNAAWVREDGRFADLARFFLTQEATDLGRGDPGADLLDRANTRRPFYNPSSNATLLNLNNDFNSALLGVEQREIYGLHMSQLDEWYANRNIDRDQIYPFDPVDERFWADADGDGRPDARWQVIDELAGAEGLIWVAAARIVDSSAAVNINTSLEGLPPVVGAGVDAADVIGDGATPADIDVYKLLYEGAVGSQAANSAGNSPALRLHHPDIINIRPEDLNEGWYDHLIGGLRLESFIEDDLAGAHFSGTANQELQSRLFWENNPTGDTEFRPDLLVTAPPTRQPTTRAQREAWWRLFASEPRNPTVSGARIYNLSEEVDLRSALGSTAPDLITELESRFDGAVDRLPEQVEYPDNLSLGPLRSGEFRNAVSTPDIMGVDRPGLSGGTYTQRDRIERIQKDVRRSLTVYSGASARSVVPPLGDKPVDRNRLKPALHEAPTNREKFVSEAFDAFMWALAPLGANKPLYSSLIETASTRYLNNYTASDGYALDADYHYGGGPNGPARGFAVDLGVAGTPTAAAADNIGPAYALFRAASLAVNLADALDDEGDQPRPTVARLFPAPTPQNLPSDTILEDVITLTTRLTQGDMADAGGLISGTVGGTPVVPTQISAQPEQGVTFVGLDRQPFISDAFAVCMYEYVNDDASTFVPDAPPNPVPINGDGRTIGRAILGVELINPWDKPIDLADHALMLTDGAESIEIPLDEVVLSPGTRHTVIWASYDPDDAGAEAPFDNDDAVNDFEAAILGGDTTIVTERGDAATFDDFDRPFETWDLASTGVLLYRDNYPNPGARVLLDRLTRTGDTDPFPQTASESGVAEATVLAPIVAGDGDTADEIGARFVTVSAMKREGGFSGASQPTQGFPVETIERPNANVVVAALTDVATNAEGWHGSTQQDGLLNHILAFSSGWGDLTLGSENDVAGGTLANDIPGFQLLLPDGPLLSVAELGMISAFAHTYLHNSTNAPTVDESDVLDTSPWTTVSEELGKDYHLNYASSTLESPGGGGGLPGGLPGEPGGGEGGGGAGSAAPNPYLGVLDPTRFILGENGDLESVPGLPDALAVPLVVRVFDAFEALSLNPREPLIQGRVNINTAPKRVLAALPMVLPVEYQTGLIPTGLTGLNPQNAYARLSAILRYRERLGGINAWSDLDADLSWNSYNYTTTADLTTLYNQTQPELRMAYRDNGSSATAPPNADQHRKGRGFVSLGELSVLAGWTPGDPASPPTITPGLNSGFTELAFDSQNNSLDATKRNALDIRPPVRLEAGSYTPFDFDGTTMEPTDDPEERLSLFRAAANSASTRSDVFHAWYIVRAYSPAAIEAIEVPAGATDQERAELLNELEPAFERRGFVVLDRSNVAAPTDRPRIVQRVDLGSTGANN